MTSKLGNLPIASSGASAPSDVPGIEVTTSATDTSALVNFEAFFVDPPAELVR